MRRQEREIMCVRAPWTRIDGNEEDQGTDGECSRRVLAECACVRVYTMQSYQFNEIVRVERKLFHGEVRVVDESIREPVDRSARDTR
jgi:hypothetical protein